MGRSPEKDVSVYDFLYVDSKRIGSFLSQFGTDGIITELSRATNSSSETTGGFDIKVASLGQKEGENSTLMRRFDPQWLLPLLFLRDAQEMIVRDLSSARIGQFVLVSGTLSVSDLSILRSLWDVAFIKKLISQGAEDANSSKVGSRNQRRAAASHPVKGGFSTTEGMLEVIKILPHGIFSTLIDDQGSVVWGSLKGEALIIPSSDLMLNHGSTISGKWSIVGVLDARPDATEAEPEVGGGGAAGQVVEVLKKLAPFARIVLGRQSHAFGVTPLLIFREIIS